MSSWFSLGPSFFLPARPPPAPVKNLIVLIMDGCGDEQLTLARWYKGGPLALDGIRTGAVKSFIADSVIADSAPAASAYATGVRTGGKIISLGPKSKTIPGVPAPSPDLVLKPCATVLEGARLLGKSTGLVVTCRISSRHPGRLCGPCPQPGNGTGHHRTGGLSKPRRGVWRRPQISAAR